MDKTKTWVASLQVVAFKTHQSTCKIVYTLAEKMFILYIVTQFKIKKDLPTAEASTRPSCPQFQLPLKNSGAWCQQKHQAYRAHAMKLKRQNNIHKQHPAFHPGE